MKITDNRYSLFGNPVSRRETRMIDSWQKGLAEKFDYNPDEEYTWSLRDNDWLGAVAGGMDNVVSMVFDNWPLAFQLVEGAKHGIQSPSAY